MKIIVMVFGLMVSAAAFGDSPDEIGQTGRCASWVNHAMYGATQSMRGASREVEFVARSSLVELLGRSRSPGGNKLYIMVDEGDTEGERGFMEQSILFGYDAMTYWQSRNAGISPSHDEWQRNFMAMCLDYEAI
jgi:hypothetical protein